MRNCEYKGKLVQVIKVLIFLIVGIILFDIVQQVLLDKGSYAQYRNWKEQEQVDVLILGNSHAANAIVPEYIEEYFKNEEEKTISVFNYSTLGMRIEQMYFLAKELLKDHTPELIVIETYAFCPMADGDREILARRAFDTFPLSVNKVEAINYCIKEDHWSYYIPFIKYHTRWKELQANDIAMVFDKNMWTTAGKKVSTSAEIMIDPQDGYFNQNVKDIVELREITSEQKECLDNLLKLAEERNINVLFVSVPYKNQMDLDSIELIKINNYIEKHYVDDKAVHMLDMNKMWDELDFGYSDLYNEGHVNINGANKVTRCLAEYLSQMYSIQEVNE